MICFGQMDEIPGCSKDTPQRKRLRRDEVFRYGDPNYEEKIMQFLTEVETDYEENADEDIPVVDSDDDNNDPDYVDDLQPEKLSDADDSDDDLDTTESDFQQNTAGTNISQTESASPDYFVSKNNFKWSSTQPSTKRKTLQHNIIKGIPGMSNEVKVLGPIPDIEDIWSLLFDETIIQDIITWTNIKLESIRENVQSHQKSNYRPTDKKEIKALIGIFMLTSIYKSNHENVLSLFSTKATGRPIFRAIMSGKRFEILIICLRFDDPLTRTERKKSDPAAAISHMFQRFVSNCQRIYSLGEYGTIDEMLVPFRGRCKFRVYMPNKPNKYGLKVLALTDARTSYFYNAYIYCGKGSDGTGLSEEEKKLTIPTQTVLRLVSPIINSNRNITADNWFSSIEVIKELLKRKLTYVGTLKKNKKEIPAQFLSNKNRKEGSALYGFTNNMTLLSYVPKKNKLVLLVSSMHHSKGINDEETNKPEMVAFYNHTKGGVDSMDQKCATYSANRRSRRWPLSIFYMMVNISTANTHILNLCFKDVPNTKRFQLIENLALKLIRPHLVRRMTIPNLRTEVQSLIKTILDEAEAVKNTDDIKSDRLDKKRKCSVCPYTKNRNTAYKCIQCQKPICLQCSKKICDLCCKKSD